MKRARLILNAIVALTLVLYSVPVQALVSLPGPAACKMSCCVVKPKVKSCCEKSAAQTVSSPSSENACKCQIKPADVPDRLSAPTATFSPRIELIALPASPVAILEPASEEMFQPGIFGLDSGPPGSPSHSPDFGRAPPVFRA